MRLCVIGDSGCLGHLEPHLLGWPGRLQQRENAAGTTLTVYNLGVRGDTSRQVRVRWRSEADARLPASDGRGLVLAFGINDTAVENDAACRVPPAETAANVDAILREANPFCPTLFVGPYPISEHAQPFEVFPGVHFDLRNARIAEIDTLLAEVCAACGTPYLSFYAALAGDTKWTALMAATDGAHPSAAAYDVLAERVRCWPAWRRLIAGEGVACEP